MAVVLGPLVFDGFLVCHGSGIVLEGGRVTDFVFYVFLVMWLLLNAVVVTAVWLCFKRSRIRSLILLGCILIMWPWLDGLTEHLRKHFLDQLATNGQRPWLFPYSLMAVGDTAYQGWRMSPAAFLTMFIVVKELLRLILLGGALMLVARALKSGGPKRPAEPTEPPPHGGWPQEDPPRGP
jgi:hypothetical protein